MLGPNADVSAWVTVSRRDAVHHRNISKTVGKAVHKQGHDRRVYFVSHHGFTTACDPLSFGLFCSPAAWCLHVMGSEQCN